MFSIKYVINGVVFISKKEIKEAVHAIRNKYEEGELLSKEDKMFMYDLLLRHPDSENKIGLGIKAFRAVIEPTYGNKAFTLIRVDDSETDFGYMKCIDGKPYTSKKKFNIACRMAVADDVIEHLNRYFEGRSLAPCEITGEIITRRGAVAHHAGISFNELIDSYLSERQIDPEMVEYKMGIDNHVGVEFSDAALREDFLKYHRAHAKLLVVDKKAHSSKSF